MQCLRSDCSDFIQENFAIQAKAYMYKDNLKLYIFKIYNLNLQLYYNLKLYIKTKYLIYYSQSLTWHTVPHIFLWLPFSSCRSHLISM